MEKLGILDRSDEGQVPGMGFRDYSPILGNSMQEPVGDALHGHVSFRTGLEMRMAGDRGTTEGTVVEDDIVRELDGEVQHVRIPVPDGLRDMNVPGNHQMVREDRRPVDQDAVLAAFPALEGKEMLMVQIVLLAKRTTVVEDGQASRIGLHGHQDAADHHLPGIYALESPVFRRHGRPHGQLVVNEFVNVDCHNLVKVGNFRGISYRSERSRVWIRAYSASKLGVRMFLPMAEVSSSCVHQRPSVTSSLSGARSGWPTQAKMKMNSRSRSVSHSQVSTKTGLNRVRPISSAASR